MRLIFSILIVIIPISIFSQIGREFNFERISGDIVKTTEIDYQDVSLDKNGLPVLPKKVNNETINYYQGGYLTERHSFDSKGSKNELSVRIKLSRVDSVINRAEIYSYFNGKESLLRAHDAEIENGKIIFESIRNEKNKNIGSVNYSYGNISEDIAYVWIDAVGNRGSRKYYTATDKLGIVSSMETKDQDTLMRLKRLEVQGKIYSKSLLVSKYGVNNSPDSILITVQKWLDDKANPTLVLTQMEALTEPPPGEPNKTNFVTSIAYEYGKSIPKSNQNILKQDDLIGQWRNERDNLELFFEPKQKNGDQRLFGSSYLLNSNEPTVEEYLEKGEIWKFMLKQDFKYSSWSIEEDGTLKVILSNESVLSFLAHIEYNTLVLKPKMKDLKGEIRLAKSKL